MGWRERGWQREIERWERGGWGRERGGASGTDGDREWERETEATA